MLFLAAPATAADPAAARAHEAEGDRLRAQGQFEAALAEYRAELDAGGPGAEVWKRIGWSLRGLHRYPEALEALRTATRIDPKDREAQDDLASLERKAGLAARAWLGGTEPGTSRQAVEGQLRYAGLDRFELQAGGGWTDNIFYDGDQGLRDRLLVLRPGLVREGRSLGEEATSYTGANRPTPDSNAYELVPRVELEVSHRFGETGPGRARLPALRPRLLLRQGDAHHQPQGHR